MTRKRELSEQQLDDLADYIVEQDFEMVAALVEYRKDSGLKQADVAERMGIDISGVSRIESGTRDLLQSTIQRYAIAIGAVVLHSVRPYTEIEFAKRFRAGKLPAEMWDKAPIPGLKWATSGWVPKEDGDYVGLVVHSVREPSRDLRTVKEHERV